MELAKLDKVSGEAVAQLNIDEKSLKDRVIGYSEAGFAECEIEDGQAEVQFRSY